MIVFLKKVRVKTIFSKFEPIKVEPLELGYLKAVLEEIKIENYIIDELFSLKQPENMIPNMIVLTGYNVCERQIILEAKDYKEKFPDVKIIVGGVHIQRNSSQFHKPFIDYVCHSQDLEIFRRLIETIRDGNNVLLSRGIDSYIYNEELEKKEWNIASRQFITSQEEYRADRQVLKEILHKTRFLEKRNVALIKGSVGCNYKCSYCYCKEINEGHYIAPDYEKMVKEIEMIEANYFWIVDDVLFSNRRDALYFIDAFKKKRPKKLIIYLRTDFILNNIDLLSQLKEVGLVEVIVGFEATDNEQLKDYEKTTNASDYSKVIAVLKAKEIDLTALFMVNPDYGFKDFKNLNVFLKRNKIEVFTVSILTPIRGTKTYGQFEKELTSDDPRKFDFLHLVLPSKLPKVIFYSLFYGLHLRLLVSKRIWKYILRK